MDILVERGYGLDVHKETVVACVMGEGGETIGERGNSKDHRPDLKQMVIGVVLDKKGSPVCSER